MVRVSLPTCSGLDVARAVTEAIDLVVADERPAAGIANDDPARFGNDRAAALLAFSPFAPETLHGPRSLRRRAGRDRRQGLGRRRRGWDWRADRGRRALGRRGAGRQCRLPCGSSRPGHDSRRARSSLGSRSGRRCRAARRRGLRGCRRPLLGTRWRRRRRRACAGACRGRSGRRGLGRRRGSGRGCPAAVCPRERLPAAQPEPGLLAAAIAWRPRAAAAEAARSSAEAPRARRSAQPEASAEPVAMMPSEAAAVRYAQPGEAAASRVWAAAAVRSSGRRRAALRAPAGAAAAGQAGAAARGGGGGWRRGGGGGGGGGGAGRGGGGAATGGGGAGRGATAGGAPFGGALGLPSGPRSLSACATTIGAVCACDAGAANCIAVRAVVASSTRRRCVMMVWVPGIIGKQESGNQRISVGPDCGGPQ